MNGERRVTIGVDFGTTYSKFCILLHWKPRERYRNSRHDRNSWLVGIHPSRIAYAHENEGLREHRWGEEVKPGLVAVSWIKLLLDDEIERSSYYDSHLDAAVRLGIMRLPVGKCAVEVASDYLRGLNCKILTTLENHLHGVKLGDCSLEYRFTLPADWSDTARGLFKEAIITAGYEAKTISFLTEPEAVMSTVLAKHHPADIIPLKRGDGVVICDCGGGTADITCYEIASEHGPIEYHELTTASGGLCGGTSVDRELYTFMSRTFGKAFFDIDICEKAECSPFMETFERAKLVLGGRSQLVTTLSLVMDLRGQPIPEVYAAAAGVVKLPERTFCGFFQSAIDKIIQLLHAQIRAANDNAGSFIINKIILTGGFSQSPLLRNAVKQAFESVGHVSIHEVEDPTIIVARGASLWGIGAPPPTKRLCPRFYGIPSSGPACPHRDSEAEIFTSPIDGAKMVNNLVNWVLLKVGDYRRYNHWSGGKTDRDHRGPKGERYPHGYSKEYPLVLAHRPGLHSNSKCFSVYMYRYDVASAKHTAPGVTLACQVCCDFQDVCFAQFEHWEDEAGVLYHVEFSVRVTFNTADSCVRFEAIAQGRIIGREEVSLQ